MHSVYNNYAYNPSRSCLPSFCVIPIFHNLKNLHYKRKVWCLCDTNPKSSIHQVHVSTQQLCLDNIPTTAGSSAQRAEELSTMAKENTLTIATVGPPGEGKSTLVNSLLPMADKVVAEGDRGETVMRNVRKYAKIRDGAEVIIYATPGLDGVHQNDTSTIEELYERAGNEVDLCLFCIAYRPGLRVDDGHRHVIRLLTERFGKYFWRKAFLVMTMVNNVHDSKRLSMLQSNVERCLLQALCDAGVPEDIVKDQYLLLAGIGEEPLWVGDGEYDWNNQLFLRCFDAIANEKKKKTFVQARYGKSVPAKVGSAIANIGAKTGAAVKGAIAYVTNW